MREGDGWEGCALDFGLGSRLEVRFLRVCLCLWSYWASCWLVKMSLVVVSLVECFDGVRWVAAGGGVQDGG